MSITYNDKNALIRYALPGGSVQRETNELKNANKLLKERLNKPFRKKQAILQKSQAI